MKCEGVSDADLAAGSCIGKNSLIDRIRLKQLRGGLGGSGKIDIDRSGGSSGFTGSPHPSNREVPLSEADCMSEKE